VGTVHYSGTAQLYEDLKIALYVTRHVKKLFKLNLRIYTRLESKKCSSDSLIPLSYQSHIQFLLLFRLLKISYTEQAKMSKRSTPDTFISQVYKAALLTTPHQQTILPILSINMRFSSVLLTQVACLSILDSTFALPVPSAVSEAQLTGGNSQLEKRGSSSSKPLKANMHFSSFLLTLVAGLCLVYLLKSRE
jgi:hypothetical protein